MNTGRTHFKVGHKINLGKKNALGYRHTEKSKEKIGGQHKHEKNASWKGENVSYAGLHVWVHKNYGFPSKCENCGYESENHRKIHWANRTNRPIRDRKNWIRLCVPCHSAYDRGKLLLL